MHEATIAFKIIEHSLRIVEAWKNSGKLVTNSPAIRKIHVAIGEFRNVDPESLDFAFNCIKQENEQTRSTELVIEIEVSRAVCMANDHKYHPDADLGFRCTYCGASMKSLERGKELDIIKLEINDD